MPRTPAAHLDWLAKRHRPLLELTAALRLLPVSLISAFFQTPPRTVRQQISSLKSRGLLKTHSIEPHRLRGIYLSPKAISLVPSLARYAKHTSSLCSVPNASVALWALHRAQMWAALRQDGYDVGRGGRHVLALRRYLVDAQRAVVVRSEGMRKTKAKATLAQLRTLPRLVPLTYIVCRSCQRASAPAVSPSAPCKCGVECYSRKVVEGPNRCSACRKLHAVDVDACCPGAFLRPAEYVDYDIAVAKHPAGGLPKVAVLIVDPPYRSSLRLLETLPLRIQGQPRVPIILRPYEEESLFNLATNRWQFRSQSFRRLEGAFNSYSFSRQNHYPYYETSTLLSYRPSIGQRTVATRKQQYA